MVASQVSKAQKRYERNRREPGSLERLQRAFVGRCPVERPDTDFRGGVLLKRST
jgi:hypothetical protein